MQVSDFRRFVKGEVEFDNVAVAIRLADQERQQRHLAFILKQEDDNAKLLHLAWHNDFRLEDEFHDDYIFFQTCNGMIEENVEMFVDWLVTLWNKNNSGMPYGLLYNDINKAFGVDGKVSDLKPGQGFTCSTFVLECFKSFGFDLIKYDTWPFREDDKKWADSIFYFLENYSEASKEHIDLQRQESDITRFRPEEVAIASNLRDFSTHDCLNFEDVAPLSSKLAGVLS